MKRKKSTSGAPKKKKKVIGPLPAALLPHGPMKNVAGTETKSVDFQVTGNLNTTPSIQVLNLIVEGASYYQRVGRRVRMKSIQTRMFAISSAANAAATGTDVKRVMIVYDRQCNGALPAYADIILSQAQGGATSSDALDMLNMNNRDRFWVLMDEYFQTPAAGINGATPASTVGSFIDPNLNTEHAQGRLNIQRYIKLGGLETQFKATAGAITDIATGSLLLITLGLFDTNATSAFNIDGVIRIKFLD